MRFPRRNAFLLGWFGLKKLFTSESVTEGHPDKLCDQVSDAILDDLLKQDPHSRVAVETLTTTGLVMVAGEVTTRAYADIQGIVRKTLDGIGYNNPEFGLDSEHCGWRLFFGKERAGRWRPGHDVRLRVQRNSRANAFANHACAQAYNALERSAEKENLALGAAGRKVAGYGRIPGRKAYSRRCGCNRSPA